jgi:hypothetical protein
MPKNNTRVQQKNKGRRGAASALVGSEESKKQTRAYPPCALRVSPQRTWRDRLR